MGLLRWDEVPGHQMSDTLLRAIGTQETVQVDTLLFDVTGGDTLMLCSDGLTEHLDDPQERSAELDVEETTEAVDALLPVGGAGPRSTATGATGRPSVRGWSPGGGRAGIAGRAAG